MKVIKAKLLTDTITPDFLYDTQPPYAKDKVATHIDICWTTRGGRNYNQVTVPLTDVELVEVEHDCYYLPDSDTAKRIAKEKAQ